MCSSPDRSLGSAATGLILCSARLISSPKTSTPALGPIQSPIQCVLTAGSFPAGKAASTPSWLLTSNWYWGWEWVKLYTLSNKNPSAWYFICPAQAVTWHTVAIIIQVVLLSPYLCIRGWRLTWPWQYRH